MVQCLYIIRKEVLKLSMQTNNVEEEKVTRDKNKIAIQQRKRIKTVLVDKFNQSGLKINQVCAILEDSRYCGYKIYSNTLSRTLYHEYTMDINVVVGLCRLWNIPFDYIFALKDPIADPEIADMRIKKLVTADGSLLNPSFMHTYYGYTFQRGEDPSSLVQFTLRMQNDGGIALAKLEMLSESTIKDETHKNVVVYSGIPTVIGKGNNTVFIKFSNTDGDFLHFYFHYREYTSQQMYYRKGFVIHPLSEVNKPTFQHCLLFFGDEAVKTSHEVLQGLLRIDEEIFEIPVDRVDDLSENEQFQKFFQKYQSVIKTEVMYRINERKIIEVAMDDGRYDVRHPQVMETIDTMLRLKSYAVSSPKHVIERNTNAYTKFAKKQIDR